MGNFCSSQYGVVLVKNVETVTSSGTIFPVQIIFPVDFQDKPIEEVLKYAEWKKTTSFAVDNKFAKR